LLERVRGFALAQCGEYSKAMACLEAALQVARSRKADYEVALTLRGLAHIAALAGRPTSEAEREAREIFERLDVIALPDAPLPELPEVHAAST
jgi:tetratricopeptide (TPR) repeat protein